MSRKGTIDRQAKRALARRSDAVVQRRRDQRAHGRQTVSGDEREWENRRSFERRVCDRATDLVAHVPYPRVGGEIGFGDHDNGPRHPEQMKDVQMLSRLRHHTIVGGDGEEDQVHPVRAREHVSDEPLVTGDVHDPRSLTAWQIEIRKSEIDRNAARLLFQEPIGILPGQRLDEAGLTVIDVPGGSDDPMQLLPPRTRRVMTPDR